jgi:hypothetical protein
MPPLEVPNRAIRWRVKTARGLPSGFYAKERLMDSNTVVIGRISPTPEPRSKKSFPMMPWYPASFLSSTRGWCVTARGVCRELLDCQWEMGGLPADPEELRRLIGASKSEWKNWPLVEPKFPICPDGLRRNPTLEKHRRHAAERSEKAAASAHEKWRRQRNQLSSPGGSDASA